ncbi:MAG: ATP-binding protein [Thalassotalea sp.]|nr:ATP-binding protein [Thalassotalea sp.]
MSSIKKKLSRYISISVSVLLVSILLITDILVDSWISNEFDRAMVNKANLLVTLVSEDPDEIDFDFAGEFMPEFEGKNDPEYFQIWHDNKVFERSDTLELFEVKDLPKLNVNINHSIITNIVLPDGRSGKMYFTKFYPQLDSDLQQEFGITREEFHKIQKPMELSYALSNEGVEQILWFVDIIFIITSLLAVIAVRMIVSNVVIRGLKPLDQLNEDLKQISLNSEISAIPTENLPDDLMAIAEGINHFIKENKALYSREKRITSDIAHELKTPIAELLNLSEVAIKFPHEKQISDSFNQDVLKISERLRNIINGILLLQKSSSTAQLDKQEINLKALITLITSRENKLNREVLLSCDDKPLMTHTNEFALETILSNLLNNAFYYSPDRSPVFISINLDGHNKHVIKVSNTSLHQYNEDDLALFFEPLWQKDSSRTSSQRYGLGLAIVKSYSEKIGATLDVRLEPEQGISFTLTL